MERELNLDASFVASLKDAQSVNPQGKSTAKVIDGVRLFQPVNHVDHRGRVFEIYPGMNEFWDEPLVYCYAFTIKLNTGKGWGLHLKKRDRYTLITGETLTVLFDPRIDSPTHGVVQKVFMSGEGVRQLSIPAGVWHLTLNIGTEEAFLINHPTEVYAHANPDRYLLDWDSREIPVDLSQFFPIQVGSGYLRD